MANEPVAWHYPDGKPDQFTTDKAYAEKDPAWTPMYYKHEWVGLTDEELLQAYGWRLASGAPNWLLEEAKQELLGALRKVEASIRGKNNG
jgi:hypothetical protein